MVSIGLAGDETGPLPEARAFYLAIPARFPHLLDLARPRLDDVFRQWYNRPLAANLWEDVKLAGFGLENPRSNPVEWDMSFEALGAKWLGITVPFRGDQPGDPVVDT